MRPLIALALITGVYPLIVIFVIIKDQWPDFIDAHIDAFNYIKNGKK